MNWILFYWCNSKTILIDKSYLELSSDLPLKLNLNSCFWKICISFIHLHLSFKQDWYFNFFFNEKCIKVIFVTEDLYLICICNHLILEMTFIYLLFACYFSMYGLELFYINLNFGHLLYKLLDEFPAETISNIYK